ELLLGRPRAEFRERVDQVAPAGRHRLVEQLVVARQARHAELTHGQDDGRGRVRPAVGVLEALRRGYGLSTRAHAATPVAEACAPKPRPAAAEPGMRSRPPFARLRLSCRAIPSSEPCVMKRRLTETSPSTP